MHPGGQLKGGHPILWHPGLILAAKNVAPDYFWLPKLVLAGPNLATGGPLLAAENGQGHGLVLVPRTGFDPKVSVSERFHCIQ